MKRKFTNCILKPFAVIFVFAMMLGAVSCTHNHKITKTYEVDSVVESISISAKKEANISIEPSTDGKIRVVAITHTKVNCDISTDGTTLFLNIEDTRNFLGRLGEIHSPKVTVYLPAGEYTSLKIETTTGNTTVPADFSFASISINGTTGKIHCSAQATDSINITNTTGEVSINNVTTNTLNVQISTGDINLTNVITTGKMSIEATTGNIKFDGCDGAEIYATATTGSIQGSLLSSKIFLTSTKTGKVTVPHTTSGGVCDLSTSTGTINITIK